MAVTSETVAASLRSMPPDVGRVRIEQQMILLSALHACRCHVARVQMDSPEPMAHVSRVRQGRLRPQRAPCAIHVEQMRPERTARAMFAFPASSLTNF